jgi:hypothetical protein
VAPGFPRVAGSIRTRKRNSGPGGAQPEADSPDAPERDLRVEPEWHSPAAREPHSRAEAERHSRAEAERHSPDALEQHPWDAPERGSRAEFRSWRGMLPELQPAS